MSEACVHSLTDMLNSHGSQNVAVFAESDRNADPNKNADPNRSLRSVIGSMRNPPTQFCECDCGNE